MAQTSVNAGETSNGAVLNSGDVQYVYGTANGTIVNNGASQELVPGTQAVANGVVVSSGGVQTVGATSNGTILNGGTQNFNSSASMHGGLTYFGEADGTVINSGGVQLAQAIVRDTVINAGGTQQLSGTAYNTLINAGGTQNLGGTAYGTRLMQGGAIALNGSYVAGGTVSLDRASDVLTVTDGGQTYTLNLAGDYSTTSFALTSSNGALTVVAQPLCFGRGTGIRTPEGDVPVEALRPGDRVVTARGAVRRVRWVGASAAIVHDGNRPVLVRAGALPGGMPCRDVRVSRGHSFLFGDVLIPIGELVNGTSIVWDRAARTAEMFHFELDAHDIVFADGACAETYRNVGNRAAFDRQSGRMSEAGAMPTCAPVVSRGPIVERTRRRLAERALAPAALSRPRCAAANW